MSGKKNPKDKHMFLEEKPKRRKSLELLQKRKTNQSVKKSETNKSSKGRSRKSLLPKFILLHHVKLNRDPIGEHYR